MNAGPTILAILYAAPQRSTAEGGAKDRVAVEAQDRSALGAQDLGAPFETTLEEALAAIERQPRGYVEPDGSFSLHASPPCDDGGSGENASVRIDGEIYDFVVPGIGSRVHHVDVRGPAVASLWRTVFDALSSRGAEGVVVFLPSAGEALSGEAFLARLAA
jgi:hypothetical protein